MPNLTDCLCLVGLWMGLCLCIYMIFKISAIVCITFSHRKCAIKTINIIFITLGNFLAWKHKRLTSFSIKFTNIVLLVQVYITNNRTGNLLVWIKGRRKQIKHLSRQSWIKSGWMEEDYGTKYEWNTFKMIMIKWSWFNKH